VRSFRRAPDTDTAPPPSETTIREKAAAPPTAAGLSRNPAAVAWPPVLFASPPFMNSVQSESPTSWVTSWAPSTLVIRRISAPAPKPAE